MEKSKLIKLMAAANLALIGSHALAMDGHSEPKNAKSDHSIIEQIDDGNLADYGNCGCNGGNCSC